MIKIYFETNNWNEKRLPLSATKHSFALMLLQPCVSAPVLAEQPDCSRGNVIPPWLGDFLAETKQLYKWFSPSVCLSVCLSVRPFFLLCSHHCQDQRSKFKATEVKTEFSRFRIITQVWIHVWRWTGTQSLMWQRKCDPLFFKVIQRISRSHRTQNRQFSPKFGVNGP